jgi:hypothetical protein
MFSRFREPVRVSERPTHHEGRGSASGETSDTKEATIVDSSLLFCIIIDFIVQWEMQGACGLIACEDEYGANTEPAKGPLSLETAGCNNIHFNAGLV